MFFLLVFVNINISHMFIQIWQERKCHSAQEGGSGTAEKSNEGRLLKSTQFYQISFA